MPKANWHVKKNITSGSHEWASDLAQHKMVCCRRSWGHGGTGADTALNVFVKRVDAAQNTILHVQEKQHTGWLRGL